MPPPPRSPPTIPPFTSPWAPEPRLSVSLPPSLPLIRASGTGSALSKSNTLSPQLSPTRDRTLHLLDIPPPDINRLHCRGLTVAVRIPHLLPPPLRREAMAQETGGDEMESVRLPALLLSPLRRDRSLHPWTPFMPRTCFECPGAGGGAWCPSDTLLGGLQVRNYFNQEGFNRWNKIYGETDEVNKVQLDIRTGHAITVDKVGGLARPRGLPRGLNAEP